MDVYKEDVMGGFGYSNFIYVAHFFENSKVQQSKENQHLLSVSLGQKKF